MASASSTSSSEARRYSATAALVIALVVVVVAELAVRAMYRAPGAFPERVARARDSLDHGASDVVLFGTCLGEEGLDHAALARALGAGARLHPLAAAGTAPLDWYLALRNLDAHGGVDALVVAFAPSDLAATQLSWQTQTLDLADWTATREIAWSSCTTPAGTDAECVVEVNLRRASQLHRNRAYLANRLWHALGVRIDGTGETSPVARDAAAAATTPPSYWLRRFLETARARHREPLFVELPGNPVLDGARAWRQREQVRARVLAALRGMRARVVSPEAPPDGFLDDVHLTADGRRRLTDAVAPSLVAMGKEAPPTLPTPAAPR